MNADTMQCENCDHMGSKRKGDRCWCYLYRNPPVSECRSRRVDGVARLTSRPFAAVLASVAAAKGDDDGR